jgi:hypothetical protein
MQFAEQARPQGKRGNPNWVAGVSGNPAGRSVAAKRARLDAIVSAWCAPFGGMEALKKVELDLLYRAAELQLRRPTKAEDAVRVANTISKILAQVGFCDKRRRREPPPIPTLRQYLAAKQGTPK